MTAAPAVAATTEDDDRFTSVEELRQQGYSLKDPWAGLLAVVPGPPAAIVLTAREQWRRGEWVDPDVRLVTVARLRTARVLPHEAEPPDVIAEILGLRRSILTSTVKGPPALPGAAGCRVMVPGIGSGYALARELGRHVGWSQVWPIILALGADNEAFDDKGNRRMPVATAVGLLEHELAVGRVKVHPNAEGLGLLHEALRRLPRVPHSEVSGIALATLLTAWASARLLGRIARPVTSIRLF